MSQSIPLLTLAMTATAELTAQHFVSHAGALPVAGGRAQGVAVTDAASGERVPVTVLGTEVVISGDALNAGDAVETDAQGRAVPLDSGVKLGVVAPYSSVATAGLPVEVLLIAN